MKDLGWWISNLGMALAGGELSLGKGNDGIMMKDSFGGGFLGV